MIVSIDGIPVYFPYEYMYPEQFQYMRFIKKTLDEEGGHCALEMPTGTGKSVCLLALITSYQYHARNRTQNKIGKLLYCTRTVQEMDKVVEELKRVIKYREECVKNSNGKVDDFLGISLTTRRNLCLHPEVSQMDNRDKVDASCRAMTASWVRTSNSSENLCSFFEGFDSFQKSLSGIFTLEDLKELGRENNICPYYTARKYINMANVVVFSYQYLIDPRIAGLVSKELDSTSIVVFDEAHNIDNVCNEAYSVRLNKSNLFSASRNLVKIKKEIEVVEKVDSQRLVEEYNALVKRLLQSRSDGMDVENSAPVAMEVEEKTSIADDMIVPATFSLTKEQIDESVPGSIRKAKHFISIMRLIIEYFKKKLDVKEKTLDKHTAFLAALVENTHLQDVTVLKHCSTRLHSLLRTLQFTDLSEYLPLMMVADFVSIAATHEKGLFVLAEPFDEKSAALTDSIIQLCCVDSRLAMKPIFDKFRSVIITSGTLSPIDLYPKLLDFKPKFIESLTMTLSRECICPIVLSKGNDQVPMTTKFDVRFDLSVIQNYGHLVNELAQIVPDGMVCFFPSYSYMEEIVYQWSRLGMIDQIQRFKLIFIETKDVVETTLALDAFKKSCDSGRGGIFLSVARGKVAEGIDFDRHYGRCVVIFGIPYQYSLSSVLRARLDYINDTFQISHNEFLTFDAMRQTAQCLGRVIRSKTDYGMMILADVRFNKSDKHKKLPPWISNCLHPEHMDLSIDRCLFAARNFLKNISQPRNRDNDLGYTLLNEDQVKMLNTASK